MKKFLSVLVILFLIFLINPFGDDKSTEEANTSGQSESQAAVEESASMVEKPDVVKEPAPAEEAKLIPGITAADVKLNLEKFGFEFTGPKPIDGQSESLDEGKAIDPNTNNELSCTITEINPMKITYLTFRTVIGSGNAEAFTAVATGFLGYCATLPYEGSEPEEAREWVEENIDKILKPEDAVTNTFGDVEYRLSGTEFAKILSLKLRE